MKIAIIGAGITGLVSGYYLSQKGHQVVIFEKEKVAGGLATSFRDQNWDWSLEFFPHHLFTSDTIASRFIKQLGLGDKLFFTRPKTSIFTQGRISQFDSPISVLASPLFSWWEKIRIGATTAYLKLNPYWQNFEKFTASSWLSQYYGKSAYQKLWQPLLIGKFGQAADQISMSWFWSRINKRTTKLGYLEGGFQVLTDCLISKINQHHGQINLGQEVTNLGKLRKDFKKIIVTVPGKIFLNIASQLPWPYRKQLSRLKMIGAVNLVLALKKPFLTDGSYWLNINQPNFPFVFVDEHTNFVNDRYYQHNHLLYVGGYYPHDHPYFRLEKQQLWQEFRPYLERIMPMPKITNFWLFKKKYAQPIVPINYSALIPPYQTPLPGVYLATLSQIYPWDRGINYSIQLGETVAKIFMPET